MACCANSQRRIPGTRFYAAEAGGEPNAGISGSPRARENNQPGEDCGPLRPGQRDTDADLHGRCARVGAAEQMARYASILGVPFQAFESFDRLNLALQGDRWKGLVLIDTPGASGERSAGNGRDGEVFRTAARN